MCWVLWHIRGGASGGVSLSRVGGRGVMGTGSLETSPGQMNKIIISDGVKIGGDLTVGRTTATGFTFFKNKKMHCFNIYTVK